MIDFNNYNESLYTMALAEVMTLKGKIGKLQGKLQSDQFCVSDMYQVKITSMIMIQLMYKIRILYIMNLTFEGRCILLQDGMIFRSRCS